MTESSTALRVQPQSDSRPPGPNLLQLASHWARAGNDLYRVFPEIAAEWGDVVNIPTPLNKMTLTLISHPEHVERVLTQRYTKYTKPQTAFELVADEPPALPLLEGDEWKRVRRIFNPFFGEQALASASGKMLDAITRQVDSWQEHVDDGRWVDLEHALGTVVMAGLLGSMFSKSVDDKMLNEWVTAVHDYGKYVVQRVALYPFPTWLKTPFERRGRGAKSLLMQRLDDMIAERLENPSPDGHVDLLDVTLGIEFEGSDEHQYRRMRSELNGLVFAGFETTAEALAWTIALLLRNPRALELAYAEVDAVGGEPIEYEHVKKLSYLKACFDEAQREQGAPVNIRTLSEDDEIGGYHMPAGSNVLIPIYGLHHDARFWRDPDIYRPERFLEEKVTKNAFIPFSTGPRKCMGSRLAYIEGVMTLATILQRYTFEVKDRWYPKHALRVSTGLSGGLPVRIYPRN
jgi:cytochrome P450